MVKVSYRKLAPRALGPLRADNGHQVCKSDGGVAAILLPHCRKAASSPLDHFCVAALVSVHWQFGESDGQEF